MAGGQRAEVAEGRAATCAAVGEGHCTVGGRSGNHYGDAAAQHVAKCFAGAVGDVAGAEGLDNDAVGGLRGDKMCNGAVVTRPRTQDRHEQAVQWRSGDRHRSAQ